MCVSSRALLVALTSSAVFKFTVDIVFLLVVRKTANTSHEPTALGQNETVELVGPAVPQCSNCQEPRAGGEFSDDGEVYLCPKCLAFHDEYFRIMAKIDAERQALNEKGVNGSGPPT